MKFAVAASVFAATVSKAAEGYCYDGVSDDKFPGTLAGSVYLSIT